MANKTKRRKVALLLKIEKFFKRYQTLFSILIPTGLSICAIIISIKSNRLTQSQIEKEKIPIWDNKFIDDGQSDLKGIQFFSIKPGFKLQNMEIYLPDDIEPNENIKTDNETWNLHEFEQRLLLYYTSNYSVPDAFSHDFSISYLTNSYPIAIKFNYVYNNEVLENYLLFEVHFKIFGKRGISIKSLTLLKTIDETVKRNINKYLSYLNNTEFVGRTLFVESKECLNDINRSDTLVKEYFYLISKTGAKHKKVLMYDTYIAGRPGHETDCIEYYIPYFFWDSTFFKSVELKKDSIREHLSDKNSFLVQSINHIDSFIKANPVCFDLKYDCVVKSYWFQQNAFDKWSDFLEMEQIWLWKMINKKNLSGLKY